MTKIADVDPWDRDLWIGRGRDHAARGWPALLRIDGDRVIGLLSLPASWSLEDRLRVATWYAEGRAHAPAPAAPVIAESPAVARAIDAVWRKCQHVGGIRRPGTHAIRSAATSAEGAPRWDVVHLDDPDGAYLDLPDDCADGFKVGEPFPDSIQRALDTRARRADSRNATAVAGG